MRQVLRRAIRVGSRNRKLLFRIQTDQRYFFGRHANYAKPRRSGAVVGGAIFDPVQNCIVFERSHFEALATAVGRAERGLHQNQALGGIGAVNAATVLGFHNGVEI